MSASRPLELQPCAGRSCAPQQWRRFLDGLKGKGPLQQLEAVNRYVNQTPYQTDMQRFGVVDHWATPREFLGRSGDCEDYALAKYLSLRHLAWRVESIRVLVLNNETRRELHAVLVAYVDGTAYILDNLAPDVQSHAAIRHYRPIFSINETTWYFHEGWSPGAVAAVGLVPQPLVNISGTHANQRAATELDIGHYSR
jgi:predicted transglutaminase-like cysteine proteinase